MKYTDTKDGKSVRVLALLKWFVRKSYVMPGGIELHRSAAHAWANELYKRMEKAHASSGL